MTFPSFQDDNHLANAVNEGTNVEEHDDGESVATEQSNQFSHLSPIIEEDEAQRELWLTFRQTFAAGIQEYEEEIFTAIANDRTTDFAHLCDFINGIFASTIEPFIC